MLKRRMLPLLVLAAATMSAVLPAQTTQTLPPTTAETQLPAIQGTGRYVTSSDGTMIAVTDSGPKLSPVTILLVHGFLHNSQVWFKQINSPSLAAFRIVTMDLRGFGYSSKPTDPTAYSDLNLQADDIEAVIHQLGLVKPVLTGWSLGGIAVQGYLEKYGDNELSGVDMVDSIVCPDTACQQTIFGGLANFPSVDESVSTDANTALAGEEGFVNLETGGTEQPSPVLSATDRLVLEEIAHTSPQFARAAALNGAATDLTPRPEILENLHVPLLVQHGTNDPIFPASLIPNEVKLVKNATVKTYANVAHMPFLLAPNAFNLDLQSWVLTKVLVHLP
jgi:pimeloyl-ACP methyl ester carboxylesterase